MQILMDVIFVLLLMLCAVRDKRIRTISNRLIFALLALGVVHLIYDCSAGKPMLPYMLTIPLFALCFMCWRQGAFGGGDVKLMTAICLYMGFWQAAISFEIGFAILILVYALRQKGHRRKRVKVPFAPPLALGCIVTLIGKWIWMM